MARKIRQLDIKAGEVTSPAQVDFSTVLTRTIESVQEDPAQLRNLIYELARIKLQREAWTRNPRMTVLETRRLMLALETAIERVETVSSERDLARSPGADNVLFESARFEPYPISVPPTRKPRRERYSSTAPILRLGLLLALVILAIAAAPRIAWFTRQMHSAGISRPAAVADTESALSKPQPLPSPPVRPQAQPFPLPTVYGVYAVSNGQLNELEMLPGRVPDQRVFMSAAIKTASRTLLPRGEVMFVVYRRDVAANAPERMQVRVIARIMRSLTFNATGKASIGAVEDLWTIRSMSYELRVAPVAENPEMLIARPEHPEFRLPSGRYGLVLKGQAYDFTIDGPVTEPVQCLERVEAANGAFYSECRPQ